MTLNCDISRTSWHMKVSDGSFFWIFHALSFEPNLYRARNSPLRSLQPLFTKLAKSHISAQFFVRVFVLGWYIYFVSEQRGSKL